MSALLYKNEYTSVQLLSWIGMNMMTRELQQSNSEQFEQYTFSSGKGKFKNKTNDVPCLNNVATLLPFYAQHNSMLISMCYIFSVCFAERNLQLLPLTNKNNRIPASLLYAIFDTSTISVHLHSCCPENYIISQDLLILESLGDHPKEMIESALVASHHLE